MSLATNFTPKFKSDTTSNSDAIYLPNYITPSDIVNDRIHVDDIHRMNFFSIGSSDLAFHGICANTNHDDVYGIKKGLKATFRIAPGDTGSIIFYNDENIEMPNPATDTLKLQHDGITDISDTSIRRFYAVTII